jgi:hypothetical protein
MSFGFGPLFRLVGKVIGGIKGLFKRSPKGEKESA